MEISPAYIEVAIDRWKAETGKVAILDGNGRTFTQVKAARSVLHQPLRLGNHGTPQPNFSATLVIAPV